MASERYPIQPETIALWSSSSISNKARFRMSRASAVLQPGVPVTLAPAGNISFEIDAGQRLRLTQPEGEQVADFV
jgi:uncharacterized protein YcgI (DUF1989 family)